jgi:lactoylglutathione lyase
VSNMIHVMIRVLDENRSVDFYRRAFGFDVVDRFQLEGFTLVYLRGAGSNFEVELTINHDRTEPYSHGDAYGHVAIAVDDLAAEHARFERAGFKPNPIKEFAPKGAFLARFFFVQDPDGYKIEVLQKKGRYR